MQAMVLRLLEYKKWANVRFFETCAGLSAAQLAAPQAIKFGSLDRTLQHVLDMDRVWRCHLTGEPHGLTSRTPETAMPLPELAAAQAEMDDWFIAWCRAAGESELEKPVSFDFVEGGSGRMSPADMLLHVVNHGTYHRGHAAAMLYEFGVAPPGTDMPVLFSPS